MDMKWRKSSRSNSQGANCVEVAALTDRVMVRDSTDTAGPVLAVSLSEWRTFTADLRHT